MWLPRRRGAVPAPTTTPAPVLLETASRPTDWAGLPPIQRVIAEQPVVLDSATFEAGLQTWHSPTFLAPLEHLVSADGPVGTADLARPRQYAPDTDMPLRRPPAARAPAVQRLAVTASAPRSNEPTGSPLVSAPAVDHPVIELRTESLPQADADVAVPAVHGEPAFAHVETAPLLGTRDDSSPAVGSPTGTTASTTNALPSSSESVTLDTSRSVDAGAGTTASVQPTTIAQSDLAAPSLTAPIAASPAPTSWRTRPGGIGAPLREMPARSSSPAQLPIQRSTSGPIVPPPGVTSATGSPVPATGLPIVMPAVDSSTDSTVTSGESLIMAAPVSMPLVAPTLGTASIGSPDMSSSGGGPVDGGHPAASDPSEPSDAPFVSARSAESGDDMAVRTGSSGLQRLVLPALGGSWREPAAAPIQRRDLVGDTPLRPIGSSAPPAPGLQRLSSGGSAAGDGSGVQLDNVAPGGSAPIPARAFAGAAASSSMNSASWSMPTSASVTSLAGPSDPWPTWTTPASAQTPAATVSRLGLGDTSSTHAAPPVDGPDPMRAVSRQVDIANTTTESVNPLATVAREAEAATPAAAPAPGGGAAVAGPDLDDLARKLYDRLRGRLAAELRLDRERIGALTDLRR